MKPGIIYGVVFFFVFVVVTGALIYLNSSFENIFAFDFSPKSEVTLSDSTETEPLQTAENKIEPNDTTTVKDSVMLSSLDGVEEKDSVENIVQDTDSNKINDVKEEKHQDLNNDVAFKEEKNNQQNKADSNEKDYSEWIKKITSIYSSMEPKKAAKIIQTYSDNVARDILYNMKKKTAAKVVSELSPETANRIFRFE